MARGVRVDHADAMRATMAVLALLMAACSSDPGDAQGEAGTTEDGSTGDVGSTGDGSSSSGEGSTSTTGDAGTSTSTGSGSTGSMGTTGEPCEPGTEGCECVDGGCSDDLQCYGNTCVAQCGLPNPESNDFHCGGICQNACKSDPFGLGGCEESECQPYFVGCAIWEEGVVETCEDVCGEWGMACSPQGCAGNTMLTWGTVEGCEAGFDAGDYGPAIEYPDVLCTNELGGAPASCCCEKM